MAALQVYYLRLRIMRIGIPLFLGVGLGLVATPLWAQNTNSSGFKDDKEKASYAIGEGIGKQLKHQYLEVDLEVLTQALRDALAGNPSKLGDREAMETIQHYIQESRMRVAKKNEQIGEAFLEKNKTKEGVKTHLITLPDGTKAEMQYKVVTEGTGPVPGSNDMVTANLRGTLIDGTEYENSASRHQPLKFGVRNAQLGISAALQMMNVGSKWILYLPASLAYGNFGTRTVEPGSAVICELELLGDETPKPITSDIIRVPSAAEMKAGAKIETIKAEDVEKMTAAQSKTNKN
jgi:FKBP-type peptidyl-prolyl cis-trans isomerase